MPASPASFSTKDLDFTFKSARAGVDGKPAARLSKFLVQAKHSLDVAIYDLKEPIILKALKKMSSKVHLRILFDAGKKGGTSTTVDPKSPSGKAILGAGLAGVARPIHEKSGHLMHDKFVIRDGNSVWTGSGNFTHGGLFLQDNNFMVIRSSAIAAAYAKTFGDLGAPGHSSSHSAGVAATPTSVKVGATPMSIYFSTQFAEGEYIEDAVIARLKHAKKVRIASMLISDPGILQALYALKAKDIKGILDPHMMKNVMHPPHGKSKIDPKLFWLAQGDPRFVAAPSHAFIQKGDLNDFMHNKLMIIDDRVVITGSFNFSENAELNDENLIIIESKPIAAAYDRYFNALFARYLKHGAPLPPT